jgi:hypothetical protein
MRADLHARLAALFCALAVAVAAQEPAAPAESSATQVPSGSDAPPAAPVLAPLAGELPSIVTAAGGPYLVTADIVVPPGKSVTFEAGVAILFRNFTGLQVHGTLIAQGTKEKPIAFTSEHDKKHGSTTSQEPAPYDWNGITITENAVGTRFEYCRIGYSLYGINALTEYFTLKDCLFRKNGKADITIKGTKQEVAAGVPYTYQPLGEAPVLAAPKGSSPGKIALQTSSIAVAVVGVALGVVMNLQYSDSKASFDNLNDTGNMANLRSPTIVEDWDAAKEAKDSDQTWMIVGYSVGGLGAAVFAVTLFF